MRNHRQSRALKVKTKVSSSSKNPPGLGRRVAPSSDKPFPSIDVTTPSSTPRTPTRPSNERNETPNASNETSGYNLRRRRRRRRITRRSTIRPCHSTRVRSRRVAQRPHGHASRTSPPTRPRARRSHECIEYKRKTKSSPPSRRVVSPSLAPRAQSINQITKTHTSVAAARTTVAAARTGRAVVVARVRASASSRRPADVNVADRAAGRAHAAGIVAARRVVVVVAIVGTAVIVVIVVANMVDVLECASLCRPGRVGVPLRKRKRRCPTDRRVLGKMTNCNSRNQPKPNKQKRACPGGWRVPIDGWNVD